MSSFTVVPVPPTNTKTAKFGSVRVGNILVAPYQQWFNSLNSSYNIVYTNTSNVVLSFIDNPVASISASGNGSLSITNMLVGQSFYLNASYANVSMYVNGGTVKNFNTINSIVYCNGSSATATNIVSTIA